MPEQFIATFSCLNRPGIVAAVSTHLFRHGCDIADAQQFDDPETGMFFMRVVFTGPGDDSLGAIEEGFGSLACDFSMHWSMRPGSQRKRVLLLTSLFHHCLADLLYRWRIDELPMEPVGIVSNHPLERFAALDFSGIPFYHLPVTAETKLAQEIRLLRIVEEQRADLVVLARYMQVLSNELSTRLTGRCINIHHSFLPGFKGARPYHQAHSRGVKLIGATAHYVTPDLDDGPIIEQDVERITHRDTPDDLVRKGRDIERRVLARAVRYCLEDQVLLVGRKTVVFAV